MDLLSNDNDNNDTQNMKWNKLWVRVCSPNIFAPQYYLWHFICYVISMKHVYIIRIRCLLCISIIMTVCKSTYPFSMPFIYTFLSKKNFLLQQILYLRSFALFSLLDFFYIYFDFIEFKQWKYTKIPIGTFTFYYIMIVSLGILPIQLDKANWI